MLLAASVQDDDVTDAQNALILLTCVASFSSLARFSSKAFFLKPARAGQLWFSGSRCAEQWDLSQRGQSPTIRSAADEQRS